MKCFQKFCVMYLHFPCNQMKAKKHYFNTFSTEIVYFQLKMRPKLTFYSKQCAAQHAFIVKIRRIKWKYLY